MEKVEFKNFPDFDLRIKAKNAFYVCPAISPAEHHKDMFFT